MSEPAAPRTISPEEVFAKHKQHERAARAQAIERATLAGRLTASFASRVLVLDIAGERVEAKYPGREERRVLFDVLRRTRDLHARLERGEPAEDDALERDVAATAAGLTVDRGLNADFFQASPYGMELALAILFELEGALTHRRHEAAAFRRDG